MVGLSVIPLRFERRTYCLEGSCSIQLSYGTLIKVMILSGHPDSNWGSPAPKAGAITGLRYIPSITKDAVSGASFCLAEKGGFEPPVP